VTGLPRVLVLETPEELAQAVADAFVADAADAIAARGAFFVALAGGTTPRAAYALLAQEPRASKVDWAHVLVYFSDERCVPPGDEQSNYHMAAQALLERVPLPERNVHPMRGEIEPVQAAREYAALLTETMGDRPRFDLLMLGMGTDGHTASLFPGSDPLAEDDRLVRAPYVEKMGGHRITFTPRVINNARHVLIATEGLTKAPALYAVLRGPFEPQVHPIQIVAPSDGQLTWMVDRAAAAELAPN